MPNNGTCFRALSSRLVAFPIIEFGAARKAQKKAREVQYWLFQYFQIEEA